MKQNIKELIIHSSKILLWYIFYQVICSLGFSGLDYVSGLITGRESDFCFTDNELMAGALFLSALLMIWHLCTFGYVRFSKHFFSSIPLSMLLKNILLIFGSMYVLNVVMEWISLPDLMEQTFMDMSDETLGIVSMALLAPVVEEMMFRGAIQGYMMKHYSNPWIGIVVTALLFGVIHMNPQQIIYAFLLGLVFGWIYYRTRSLLPVMAGHVLNNSIAVISMQIWGDKDMEALSSEEKTVMIPFLLFITAMLVLLALKINRGCPPVPKPWRSLDE